METINGKMEFYYQFDTHFPEVKVTLHPTSDLSQVFEAFAGFLRGAGYAFNGEIQIVDNDMPQIEESVN